MQTDSKDSRRVKERETTKSERERKKERDMSDEETSPDRLYANEIFRRFRFLRSVDCVTSFLGHSTHDGAFVTCQTPNAALSLFAAGCKKTPLLPYVCVCPFFSVYRILPINPPVGF